MMKFMPFFFAAAFGNEVAPPRVIQYAGTEARDVAFAAAGAQARFPLNVFVACSHEMECVRVNLAPAQQAKPDVIRKMIQSQSRELIAIEEPLQLQMLRQQLDRLGTLSAHVDGIQVSCADVSNIVCKVTPYDGEFFE